MIINLRKTFSSLIILSLFLFAICLSVKATEGNIPVTEVKKTNYHLAYAQGDVEIRNYLGGSYDVRDDITKIKGKKALIIIADTISFSNYEFLFQEDNQIMIVLVANTIYITHPVNFALYDDPSKPEVPYSKMSVSLIARTISTGDFGTMGGSITPVNRYTGGVLGNGYIPDFSKSEPFTGAPYRAPITVITAADKYEVLSRFSDPDIRLFYQKACECSKDKFGGYLSYLKPMLEQENLLGTEWATNLMNQVKQEYEPTQCSAKNIDFILKIQKQRAANDSRGWGFYLEWQFPNFDCSNFGQSMIYTARGIDFENMTPHDPNQWDKSLLNLGLSLWVTGSLESLIADFEIAKANGNRTEMLSLIRKVVALLKYKVTAPSVKPKYLGLLEKFNSKRDELARNLWTENLSVPVLGGVPRNLTLMTEFPVGSNLQNRAMPTSLLVSQEERDGRSVLGTLKYQGNTSNQEIVLNFTTQLVVEPLLEESLKKMLSAKGESYQGIFNNWDLKLQPIKSEGIIESSAVQNGDLLDVTLRLNPVFGAQTLWKLTSDTGIPVTINYEYRKDREQKGVISGLSLSFKRRQKIKVFNQNGVFKNGEQVPVSVEYIKLSNGNIVTFNPAVGILPGQTTNAPKIEGIDYTNAVIPVESVSFNTQNALNLNDFYNLGDSQLIDVITVKNLLPTFNTVKGTRLQYVQVKITYFNAQDAPQNSDTFNLLPSPTEASQKSVPFFRISKGDRKMQFDIKAVYENGSQSFSKTYVNENNIEIREDMINS